MANENLDGIEIPQDLLDAIAGGFITDNQKDDLKIICDGYKKAGLSSDDVFNQLKHAAEVQEGSIGLGELEAAIQNIWWRA